MAHVIGNSGRVFPNSHSGRLTADNPASQHRISAIKTGDVNKLLIYVSFFAVPAGRAFQYRTVFYQLNIGAFAGEYRLFTISSQFSGFGIGRQDIGRPGEHFVKHRKHGLVRHQSFPQRFYPAHLRHTTGQILCKHKLPRIKLEHTVYRHTVGRKQ